MKGVAWPSLALEATAMDLTLEALISEQIGRARLGARLESIVRLARKCPSVLENKAAENVQLAKVVPLWMMVQKTEVQPAKGTPEVRKALRSDEAHFDSESSPRSQ